MAELLKGGPVAAALKETSAALCERLKAAGVTPTLVTVRAGKKPDDIAYENALKKRCAAMGVAMRAVVLDESAEKSTALSLIRSLNSDSTVHGVLLFRPMPKAYDEAVRLELSPQKDVDGVTDGTLAKLFRGVDCFAPCTAAACLLMLDHYGIDPAGKTVAIAGRSLVVGKPAAMLFCGRDATVTLCHSKTKDLRAALKGADIVLAAIGKARFFDAGYFSAGQTVLDVGINMVDGQLTGDVDFDAVEPLVSAITPVPGGVGTITTALLVANVIKAAAISQGVQV